MKQGNKAVVPYDSKWDVAYWLIEFLQSHNFRSYVWLISNPCIRTDVPIKVNHFWWRDKKMKGDKCGWMQMCSCIKLQFIQGNQRGAAKVGQFHFLSGVRCMWIGILPQRSRWPMSCFYFLLYGSHLSLLLSLCCPIEGRVDEGIFWGLISSFLFNSPPTSQGGHGADVMRGRDGILHFMAKEILWWNTGLIMKRHNESFWR